MARPSKIEQYKTPKVRERIKAMCKAGYSQSRIAEELGISRITLGSWLKNDREFRNIFDVGYHEQEEIVLSSLMRLITGYWDEETTTEQYKVNNMIVKDDPKLPTKIITKRRFVPPNPASIMFWLKCRARWSERHDIGIEVKEANPLTELTTAELKALANNAMKAENDENIIEVDANDVTRD